MPGAPVSGNHNTYGNYRLTSAARRRRTFVALIARAEASKAGWKAPRYVRVDLTVWNSRLDRDNASKEFMDALQGIVFAYDSRVLDGFIARRRDKHGPRIDVYATAVDGKEYGYR